MSKKSDSYYFQNFIECVECGCQAAKMLEGNLNHFDTGLLQDKLDELHHHLMLFLIRVMFNPVQLVQLVL